MSLRRKRITRLISFIFYLSSFIFFLSSCRGDIYVQPAESEDATDPRLTGVSGFYLLNEGNMGSNKASLDYFDETAGTYTRNIYAERNPSAVKELGDVGNDLLIYGSRLYAVINCSHKVEVMHAADTRRITHIDIANPRYAIGYGRHVYVSSYVTPNRNDPKAPLGAVYKIDTLSLKVVDHVDVGYQPEEMAIVDGKLYVANSGGYRKPNYDRTISVIDLPSFTPIGSIDVAINLHRLQRDSRGMLYVTSRGDNAAIPSRLYVVDPDQSRVVNEIDIPVSNFWIHGDSAYIYHAKSGNNSYAILNLLTHRVDDSAIIKDGTDSGIKLPSLIAVHPITREIFIADARNYVSSGRLHCYSPKGLRLWTQTTGEIPSSLTFR